MSVVVAVTVLRVGNVGMSMLQLGVVVQVAVCASRYGVVTMQVVAVVMGVGMLVRQRFMFMQMAMRLSQMQRHTRQHDAAADRHARAQRAIAQRDGKQPANEGREGEHLSRAGRAKGALGEEIKAQAQAIAACTDRQ